MRLTEDKHKISVVIPAYNCGEFLSEAIESILNQTYPVDEIIVIDDGSTDNTEVALSPYLDRIIYIYKKNGGAAQARNSGLKRAGGVFIAFLDADDIWVPDKIEKQMKVFKEDPDAVLVYSRMANFEDGSSQLAPFPPEVYSGFIFDILLVKNFISLPTVIFKRHILNDVGFFNENLTTSEDTNFFLRIAKKYKLIGMSEILLHRRLHNKNISDRFDVNVGTIQCLDNIVSLFPECDPKFYPVMKKAYFVRGEKLVRDSFYAREYSTCHRACQDLIVRKIINPKIITYWLITLLPGFILDYMRNVRKAIKN